MNKSELIDVMNQEKYKGRIKIYGISIWTVSRFKESIEVA